MISTQQLEELGFVRSAEVKSSVGNVFFTKDGAKFRLCYMCNFFAMTTDDGRPHPKYKLRLNSTTIDDVKKLLEEIQNHDN